MCCFLSLLFLTFTFVHSTRYVATDGTGSDPCSSGNPCNFTYALGIALEGDSIHLNNGVYSSDLGSEKDIDIELTIEGETRDGVILESEVNFILDSGKSFTLKQLTVRNMNSTFLYIGSSGEEEVQIEDVKFADLHSTEINGAVIYIDKCANLTFRNVEGEDVGIGITDSFIRIETSCNTFLISNSSFNNNFTGGKIGYIKFATNVFICDSIFSGSKIRGVFTFSYCDNLFFTRSRFEDCLSDTGGGAFNSYQHVYVDITNCTFISCSASTGGAIYFDEGAFDNVYFTGCLFEGCYSKFFGGAIYFHQHENVDISNCTFTSCTSGYGGALNIYYGNEIYITGCLFEECNGNSSDSIDGKGGAIYSTGSSHIEILTSTFTSCSSFEGGGALFFLFDERIYIKGSSFVGCNSRSFGGGAIYSYLAEEVELSNSTFTSCNNLHGGAMYVEIANNVYVTGCFFQDCNVTENGGAIYSLGSYYRFDVSNSVFKSCSANNGGAVYVEDHNDFKGVSFSNSTFTSCSAFQVGGAIYSSETSALNVTDSTFIFCSSNYSSGAIHFLDGIHLNVKGCNFEGCRSNYCGGAIGSPKDIYEEGEVDFSISNSTFVSCTSEYGGAIYATEYYREVSVASTTFKLCKAEKLGGGVFVSDTNLLVSFSTFTECEADGGGGISHSEGILEITGSRFEGCKALLSSYSKGGGIITENSLNLKLEDTHFVGCSSRLYGGGIFIDGTQEPSFVVDRCEFDCCTIENLMEGGGGGLFFVSESGYEMDDGSLDIVASSFSSCYGGGLSIIGKEDVSISSSSFFNHSDIDIALAETFDVSCSDFEEYITIGFENIGSITVVDSNFTSNSRFWKEENEFEFIDPDVQNAFGNAVFENCQFSGSVNGVGTSFGFPSCDSVIFDKCMFENINHTVVDLYRVKTRFEMRSSVVRSIYCTTGSSGVVNVRFDVNSLSQSIETLISESTFEDIIVQEDGNALHIDGRGNLLVEESTFMNGEFHGKEGAISVQDLEEVEIKNSRFENCFVTHEFGEGGGVYVYSDTEEYTFTLTNTTFDRCSTGFRGGTVFLEGVLELTVENVSITNSEAGEQGGGMYVRMFESIFSSPQVSITNSNFSVCNAAYGGGSFMVNPGYASVSDFLLRDVVFDGCGANVSGSSVFINTQSTDLRVVDTLFSGCIFENCSTSMSFYNPSSFHAQHYVDEESGNQGFGFFTNITFQSVVALNSKIYVKDVNFYAERSEFSTSNGVLVYDSIIVSDSTEGSFTFYDIVVRSNIPRPMDEDECKTLMYIKAETVHIPYGEVDISGVDEVGALITIVSSGKIVLRDLFIEDKPIFSIYSDVGVVEFSNCTFEGPNCKYLIGLRLLGTGLMMYDINFNECEGNIIDTASYFLEEPVFFLSEGIVLSNVNVISPRSNDHISIFRFTGYGTLTVDGIVFDGGVCEESLSSYDEEYRAFFLINEVRGGVVIRNSTFRNNTIRQDYFSVLRLSQFTTTASSSFENVVIENNIVDPRVNSSNVVSIDFPVGRTVYCSFRNNEFRNNSNSNGLGGCIFNRNGYVEIVDSTMVDNSALLGGHVYSLGGTIDFSGHSLILEQNTFGEQPSGSVHSEDGGVKVLDTTQFRDSGSVSCVYVLDGSIQVSPFAMFSNCHNSGGSGGAINLVSYTRYIPFTPVLSGSFFNCSASENGGAVSLRFANDPVLGSGGAIDATYFISSDSSLMMISNCSSGQNGGAFFIENINLLFTCEMGDVVGGGFQEISFVGNTAYSYGGAILSQSTVFSFDKSCHNNDTSDRVIYFEFRDNIAAFGSDIYETGVIQSERSDVVPDNPEDQHEWLCFDFFDISDSKCFRNYENQATFPHESTNSGLGERTFSCDPSNLEILEPTSYEVVQPGEVFTIRARVRDCYGELFSSSYTDGYWVVIAPLNGEETVLKSSFFEVSLDLVDSEVVEFTSISFSRLPSSHGETTVGVYVWIENEVDPGAFGRQNTSLLLGVCQTGYYRSGEEEVVCSPCARGTYTLEPEADECVECPDNVEYCDSTGKVLAAEGYWSYVQGDNLVILTCANGKCEIGNNCSAGYDSEAPICAACADGYAEWSGGCSKCGEINFKFCVLLLLLIIFLVFQVLSLHMNSQVMPVTSAERIYSFFGQSYKLATRSVSWGHVSGALTPILAFLVSYQMPTGEEAVGDERNQPFLAYLVLPFNYIYSQVFSCPFSRGSYVVVWGDYFEISSMMVIILVGIAVCFFMKICSSCICCVRCALFSFISPLLNTKKKKRKLLLVEEKSLYSEEKDSEEEESNSATANEFDIKDIAEAVTTKMDDEEDKELEDVRIVHKEEEAEKSPKQTVLFKKVIVMDDVDSDDKESSSNEKEELEEGGEIQNIGTDRKSEESDDSDSDQGSSSFESTSSEGDSDESSSENNQSEDSSGRRSKLEELKKKKRKEQKDIWSTSSPLDFWIATVQDEVKYRESNDTDYVTKFTGCSCLTFGCRLGISLLKELRKSEPTTTPWHERALNKFKKGLKIPEWSQKWYIEILPFLGYVFLGIPSWLCCKFILKPVFKGFYSTFLRITSYQRTLITFSVVTYQIVFDNALGYIVCMRYQDHYVNVRRSDIQCFNNFWFASFPIVFFLPLVYCIFLPFFYLFFLFLNKRRMYQPKTQKEEKAGKLSFDERYGTLYLCYRKNCWWYEFLSFFRKVFIVFIVNFSTTWTELGNFLSCFFLGLFVLFHLVLRPYDRLLDNVLEGLSLISLFILVSIRASFIYIDFVSLAVVIVFFSFVPLFVILFYLKFRILFISCLKRLESFFLRKCCASCLICCLPNLFTCYWCCFYSSDTRNEGRLVNNLRR